MNEKTKNSPRSSAFWPLLVGMVLLALILIQFNSVAGLRAELAELKKHGQSTTSKKNGNKSALISRNQRNNAPTIIQHTGNSDVESRLLLLEDNLAALNKNAAHLMDRGQIPPDDVKAEEWKARFANADLSTNARKTIETLRLLRRNDLFDDAMAAHAATLLTQSTNGNVTRALMDALRSAKNEALKPAFLALAADSKDGRVRWNAVNNLRAFAEDDSGVEAALWKIATTDESREIRSRAEDSLRSIPLSDARQADLAAKVTNTGLDFNERWSAFRVLGNSKEADLSQVALSLVQASSVATDDETKIAYIRAFDDVNHDEFMVPLVNSVQDPSAEVRLRATDALVDYKNKDPNVMEWLKVLMESDPDPRVRKEASRAFQKPQQRRRR